MRSDGLLRVSKFCTRMIKNVTVFCASSPSGDRAEEYLQMARDFGVLLAKSGFVCINGGSWGMMEKLCKSMHEAGGEVHCVSLGGDTKNPEHNSYTSIEHLFPLSPRQQRLIERGDAFVALAGGVGTHYEIFEVLCRKMMGEIGPERPLICVGDGYEDLKNLLKNIVRNGLAFADPTSHILFVSTVDEVINFLRDHRE